MSKKDGLKVLNVEIKNFKNITQKEVEFNGKSAIILGANGKGKSSFLQAISSPLNAKMIPNEPIKKGEESASLEVTVGGSLGGEEQTYIISMHFNEAHQKGKIVITDDEENKIPGGRKMVDSIIGNIGFDILDFINLGLTRDGKVSKPGVREQIELLKSFLPEEARKQLHDLDEEKKEVYEERADVNRDLKHSEAKLNDISISPEEQDKYAEKRDDKAIKEKMAKIGDEVSMYDKVVTGIETKKLKISALEKRIAELQKDIDSCKAEVLEVYVEVGKGDEWLKKKGERPSMEALSTELKEVEEHNLIHNDIAQLKEHAKQVRELKEVSEAKSKRYLDIDSLKSQVFKKHPLPVADLSFNEEEILYKELPFNELQHPSSVIIGVGLKIAMAMNPNLKLLIIKDGSLLDGKMLKYVLKLVDKEGYQVLIEQVDQTGEKDLTVNFIETEVK